MLGIILLLLLVIAIVMKITCSMAIKDAKTKNESNSEIATARKVNAISWVGIFLFSIILVFSSLLYTQDPGEAIVIQNWGGSLAGHSSDAGFHFKSPWQDTIRYDVRNNILSFVGDGEEDYSDGSCRGPMLTINDKGGAAANIDVQVNYALDPSYVETLYMDYGTQESFVHAICAVDIRATAREVAGGMDTITILTNRGDFSSALYDALTKKWSKYGINVEQVNVQDVRYSAEIHAAYAAAQQAEIDKATALNKQEVEKTNADTKVEVAKREAEANNVLTQSLSSEVLRQKYIEALKTAAEHDNLVVVPEGSNPIINTNK